MDGTHGVGRAVAVLDVYQDVGCDWSAGNGQSREAARQKTRSGCLLVIEASRGFYSCACL